MSSLGHEHDGGYLLCASPRSGSTLLCDMLARTRAAGQPASYFRPASVLGFANEWGQAPTDVWGHSYVDAVRVYGDDGTGRFGMRIMWSDMPPFLERLAGLYPRSSDDRDRLRSTFGIEHFVRLSREDKVAQAISLVIASQSGVWHRNADGSIRQQSASAATVRYDHGLIENELRMLEAEEQGWSDWFAATSITPLALTYEALSRDPAEQVGRILRFLGCAPVQIRTGGTAKLATSLNHEWAERFRSEQDQPAPTPEP